MHNILCANAMRDQSFLHISSENCLVFKGRGSGILKKELPIEMVLTKYHYELMKSIGYMFHLFFKIAVLCRRSAMKILKPKQ